MKSAKTSPVLALALVITTWMLAGCSPSEPPEPPEVTVAVPELEGATEKVAESSLAALGLVPIRSSENSDSVDSGNVIRTSPAAGEKVELGSQVVFVLSDGPARITALDSYMEWKWVGSREENWDFDHPYIQNDELVLRARPTFSRSFKWHDVSSNRGYGVAAVNDTFDKAVPLRIEVTDENVASGEEQSIVIRIPLTGIEVTPPTLLFMRLFIDVNGREREIPLTLTMSW